jgi:hypothetical protein
MVVLYLGMKKMWKMTGMTCKGTLYWKGSTDIIRTVKEM